jgi:hypothetical protein
MSELSPQCAPKRTVVQLVLFLFLRACDTQKPALKSRSLRDVIALPTDSIGSVQEVAPIAQSRFRVLVNRDDDGLHVVEAVALPCSHVAHIGQRLNPGRIVGVGVVPFERFTRRWSGLFSSGLPAPPACETSRSARSELVRELERRCLAT